jgi:toxin ParE1/3/4
MKFRITISEDAESDLDNAFIWYEFQKLGLGEKFIRCISDALLLIQSDPKAFPIVFENIRRCIVKKFPFVIYYIVNEKKKETQVIAFFHSSRNPEIWKKRN